MLQFTKNSCKKVNFKSAILVSEEVALSRKEISLVCVCSIGACNKDSIEFSFLYAFSKKPLDKQKLAQYFGDHFSRRPSVASGLTARRHAAPQSCPFLLGCRPSWFSGRPLHPADLKVRGQGDPRLRKMDHGRLKTCQGRGNNYSKCM